MFNTIPQTDEESVPAWRDSQFNQTWKTPIPIPWAGNQDMNKAIGLTLAFKTEFGSKHDQRLAGILTYGQILINSLGVCF